MIILYHQDHREERHKRGRGCRNKNDSDAFGGSRSDHRILRF
ncbi:MAG: hypothetical protein VKN72_27480 [Nostocales cyanobacterium 94392]|nr:hypothetical protein [Nostocales cyanobacterium 94392]